MSEITIRKVRREDCEAIATLIQEGINKIEENQILKVIIAEKKSQRDENETYGEYVAQILKKLDNHSRIMTKHYINDVLKKAELGEYKELVP